jgi:hypothetical protein
VSAATSTKLGNGLVLPVGTGAGPCAAAGGRVSTVKSGLKPTGKPVVAGNAFTHANAIMIRTTTIINDQSLEHAANVDDDILRASNSASLGIALAAGVPYNSNRAIPPSGYIFNLI